MRASREIIEPEKEQRWMGMRSGAWFVAAGDFLFVIAVAVMIVVLVVRLLR